ncbi:MAG: YlxR family protein [Eubacteriaceae bacterium]|jgi:predicted RNA-binding protein YlxR (DUF448 family)|nr:YlxR family protein [Eubacteriaceae bacterium]
MKKQPLRTCVVCHEKFDKRDLLRIVSTKDGDLFYDPTGKKNGRGAYICKKKTCIDTFLEKNLLERTFKKSIDPEKTKAVKQSIVETLTTNNVLEKNMNQ